MNFFWDSLCEEDLSDHDASKWKEVWVLVYRNSFYYWDSSGCTADLHVHRHWCSWNLRKLSINNARPLYYIPQRAPRRWPKNDVSKWALLYFWGPMVFENVSFMGPLKYKSTSKSPWMVGSFCNMNVSCTLRLLSRLLTGPVIAAVKHSILLMRPEAATALPVACPHMGQHGQFGLSQGRPQAVQWLLHVSWESWDKCCV